MDPNKNFHGKCHEIQSLTQNIKKQNKKNNNNFSTAPKKYKLPQRENDACKLQYIELGEKRRPNGNLLRERPLTHQTAVHVCRKSSEFSSHSLHIHMQKYRASDDDMCSTLLYSSNTSSVVFKISLTKVSGGVIPKEKGVKKLLSAVLLSKCYILVK